MADRVQLEANIRVSSGNVSRGLMGELRLAFEIGSASLYWFSCQLESNSDIGCKVDGLSITRRRTKANLLNDAACFFIQPVSQSMNNSLDKYLAVCRESYTQLHVSLHLELARF